MKVPQIIFILLLVFQNFAWGQCEFDSSNTFKPYNIGVDDEGQRGKNTLRKAELLLLNRDTINAICHYHDAFQRYGDEWSKKRMMDVGHKAMALAEEVGDFTTLFYFKERLYERTRKNRGFLKLSDSDRYCLFEYLSELYKRGYNELGIKVVKYWIRHRKVRLSGQDKVELLVFYSIFSQKKCSEFTGGGNYPIKDDYIECSLSVICEIEDYLNILNIRDDKGVLDVIIGMRYSEMYYLLKKKSPDVAKLYYQKGRKRIIESLVLSGRFHDNFRFYTKEKQPIEFDFSSINWLVKNDSDNNIIQNLLERQDNQNFQDYSQASQFISGISALGIYFLSEEDSSFNSHLLQSSIKSFWGYSYVLDLKGNKYQELTSLKSYAKMIKGNTILYKQKNLLESDDYYEWDFFSRRNSDRVTPFTSGDLVYFDNVDIGIPCTLVHNLNMCYRTYRHWKNGRSNFKRRNKVDTSTYVEQLRKTLVDFKMHPELIKEYFGDYMAVVDSLYSYHPFEAEVDYWHLRMRDSLELQYFTPKDGVVYFQKEYEWFCKHGMDSLTYDEIDHELAIYEAPYIKSLSKSYIKGGIEISEITKVFNSIYDNKKIIYNPKAELIINNFNKKYAYTEIDIYLKDFDKLLNIIIENNVRIIDPDKLEFRFPLLITYENYSDEMREIQSKISKIYSYSVEGEPMSFDLISSKEKPSENTLNSDISYLLRSGQLDRAGKLIDKYQSLGFSDKTFKWDIDKLNYEQAEFKNFDDAFKNLDIDDRDVFFRKNKPTLIGISKIGSGYKSIWSDDSVDSIYLRVFEDTFSYDVIGFAKDTLAYHKSFASKVSIDTPPELIFQAEIQNYNEYHDNVNDEERTRFFRAYYFHFGLMEYFPILLNAHDLGKASELIHDGRMKIDWYKKNVGDNLERNVDIIASHTNSIIFYKMGDVEKGNELYEMTIQLSPIVFNKTHIKDSIYSINSRIWNKLYYDVYNEKLDIGYYEGLVENEEDKGIILFKAIKSIQDDLVRQKEWGKILILDELAQYIFEINDKIGDVIENHFLWFKVISVSNVTKNVEERLKVLSEIAQKIEDENYRQVLYMVQVFDEVYRDNIEANKLLEELNQELDSLMKRAVKNSEEANKNREKAIREAFVADSLRYRTVQQNIKLKETEKELKEAYAELENQNIKLKSRTLFLFIIFIVALGLSLALFSYSKTLAKKRRDLEKQNAIIKGKNKELEEKNAFIDSQMKEYSHTHLNELTFIASQLSYLSRDKYRFDEKIKKDISKVEKMIINSRDIYELLFKKEDKYSSTKEFLKELVAVRLGQFSSRGLNVELDFDIDDVMMRRGTLQNIGRIINEAVRNSCKHAFSGIDNPTIFINYKVSSDREHHVMVSDNGNGFDYESIEIEKSDGLSLMKRFCTNLLAELQIDTNGKTAYSFTYNPKLVKNL